MPLNKSAALLMGVAREGRELALLLVPAPRWLPAASVSQLTAAAADYYAAAVPPMPQHVNAAEPSTQLGSSFAIPRPVPMVDLFCKRRRHRCREQLQRCWVCRQWWFCATSN